MRYNKFELRKKKKQRRREQQRGKVFLDKAAWIYSAWANIYR